MSIHALQKIPGVGPAISEDLFQIGIRSVEDLRGKDPEVLYQLHNDRVGRIEDRCLLYVFRCAVYYANTPKDLLRKDKLLWWNWKD